MKHVLSAILITMIFGTATVVAQQTQTTLTPVAEKTNTTADVFSYFKASAGKDRVVLDWAIADNKAADRFEVERSEDGKNFKMVALVFCSEETGSVMYSYFERPKNAKQYYRLKKINKDQQWEYSTTVVPES